VGPALPLVGVAQLLDADVQLVARRLEARARVGVLVARQIAAGADHLLRVLERLLAGFAIVGGGQRLQPRGHRLQPRQVLLRLGLAPLLLLGLLRVAPRALLRLLPVAPRALLLLALALQLLRRRLRSDGRRLDLLRRRAL